MLVEENISKFNSSDCLEYKTLANSALHRIWRIRIGFLREKTLAIVDQSAKFANVFSHQHFPLYSILNIWHKHASVTVAGCNKWQSHNNTSNIWQNMHQSLVVTNDNYITTHQTFKTNMTLLLATSWYPHESVNCHNLLLFKPLT